MWYMDGLTTGFDSIFTTTNKTEWLSSHSSHKTFHRHVKRVVEKYFNLDIIRLSKQLPPLALLLLKDSRGMNLVMIVVIYKHRVKCWDKTWDSKKFLFFRVYLLIHWIPDQRKQLQNAFNLWRSMQRMFGICKSYTNHV